MPLPVRCLCQTWRPSGYQAPWGSMCSNQKGLNLARSCFRFKIFPIPEQECLRPCYIQRCSAILPDVRQYWATFAVFAAPIEVHHKPMIEWTLVDINHWSSQCITNNYKPLWWFMAQQCSTSAVWPQFLMLDDEIERNVPSCPIHERSVAQPFWNLCLLVGLAICAIMSSRWNPYSSNSNISLAFIGNLDDETILKHDRNWSIHVSPY